MLLSVIYVDENCHPNELILLGTKANPKTALSMPMMKSPICFTKTQERWCWSRADSCGVSLPRSASAFARTVNLLNLSIPQPTILYISWTRDVLVNSPEGSLICSSNIHCFFIFERDSPSNCDPSAVLPLSSKTVFLIETFQSCRWLKGRS